MSRPSPRTCLPVIAGLVLLLAAGEAHARKTCTAREAGSLSWSAALARGKHTPRTRVVGLTGGIASGKSTVSRMFQRKGARVVDADQLARRIVEPGRPAYRDIVRTFGKQILQRDGTLNRKRLGQQVFADPKKLAQLNRITHPRIARAARREIRRHRAAGVPLVIYDAALLVEAGWHRKLDKVVVVSVPQKVQVERLAARDGVSRAAALQRVRSQLPLSAKLALADHVINNGGSLKQTQSQVNRLWRALSAR